MTLRARLFALVSAAVVLTVLLVAATVSASARQSFADLDAQRTAALVAQFRRDFTQEADDIVRALERVAMSENILRIRADLARETIDYAPYVDEAKPLAAAQNLDILDIVDGDGIILSSAHWPARFGHRNTWAIQRSSGSATPHEFLQVVDVPQGSALGLVAVQAVDAGDRRLHLAGGRRLDSTFLQSLELPAGVRVLLYRVDDEARPQMIAATDDSIDSEPFGPLVAETRSTARENTDTIRRSGRDESAHAIPLAGRDGRVAAILLVVSGGEELAALIRRIRWSAVAFGGLGIALGFVLSYIVAARVTRPIEQLATVARTVAEGDWSVEVPAMRASTEVATLADSFETMTRQLLDQRERLIQAERVAAWREVARRLAHELKNPLFPLRITLDNLRRAKPLPAAEFDEVFDESINTLSVGVTNLNTVIGRFSDFARMPAPVFATVSPNTVVSEAVALFRPQFERHPGGRIEVVLDLDPRGGTIRADAEQLGRVVQNLLLNAIDAMPTGGTATVRTRRLDGALHIEVADTGQGIEPHERERLFTPYYTTKQHGTGLGLAIVQSVVTDHRGKISVTGAPGQGTTFHIELPL
jgi:signal transduction histidine kinase